MFGLADPVKEKELRLALVCYGGISLAVYMHAVTKEILKLLRASRALHGDGTADAPGGTEAVYLDFLRQIGQRLDLRVIVDVISGASAGGINGVILARAIAHDLPMDGLRDVWLREADVAELLAETRRSGKWSKWFLRPFIWAWTRRLDDAMADDEMRTKLSAFLRSRWFKPPFDGEHLSDVLLRTIDGMGDPAQPGASLLPAGQQLDLFVTVTDYYGYLQQIQIHDPPVIEEREHRHVLHFAYRRWPNGEEESEFDRLNAPSLAFAARASSSFPGAFPPTQICEMDEVTAKRGIPWITRSRFLARNFRRYAQAGMDPTKTSFVDGSVLNNKPFAEAIRAIKGRTAYRDVDRRIIYIDPHPEQPPPPPDGRVPGWFKTIKDVLSDIPRNQPVFEELEWISGFNARVRRMKAIIEASRPQVVGLVEDFTKGALAGPLTPQTLAVWREAANARAAREAGFVYDGYVRLKIGGVIEYVAHLIAEVCGFSEDSKSATRVRHAVAAWARETGAYPADGAIPRAGNVTESPPPPWVRFALRFDLAFRQRRLRFLLRGLNLLYARLDTPDCPGLTAAALDGTKGALYEALDMLRHYGDSSFIAPATAQSIAALFAPLADEHGAATLRPADFAAAQMDAINTAIETLGREINLKAANERVDRILATLRDPEWPLAARRELLIAYFGFAFWDMLTFSLTNWRDLDEYEEMRVDRISPDDARSIRAGGAAATLKGIEFSHFGAFFSRRHRENDYLWGRLHAAERLIDILCDAVKRDAEDFAVNIPALKKRAFEAVLAEEAKHLLHSPKLLADVMAEVAAMKV